MFAELIIECNPQHESTITPECDLSQNEQKMPEPELPMNTRSVTPKSMHIDETSEAGKTDVVKKKPKSKSQTRKLWKQAGMKQITKMRPEPIFEDELSNETDSVHSSEIDLRCLPIILDEYDDGFKKVLTVKGVLQELQTSQKQGASANSRNISDAEKLRRQEEKLKLFTNVYDPLSGSVVHYLQLQQKGSRATTQSMYFHEQNRVYSRKKGCTLQ